jgi:hypothetical protein
VHRLLPLLVLWLVGCPARTERPVTRAPAAVSVDRHSFARPHEVAVAHFGLRLDVDFATRTLGGTATIRVVRRDRGAPLRLDTRGLDITQVELAPVSSAERIATLEAGWFPTTFALHDPVEHLGRGLEIQLPPQEVLVRVHYTTSPDASGLQWLSPEQTGDRAAPFLYSQSQAIHARSWFPCQDSPGVRSTHDAVIRTPSPTRALMAAEAIEGDGRDPNDGRWAFVMREPVPAYLVALAVGKVEFASLGERSGVWAEPSMLPRAAYELADTERMLTAIEALYGPYRWGRYDVLVLPPSFPFGGMENPRLTFATPTIIAGDRSLVSLIAHELAHSWSGNLVTNATWEDLWLNEGFTVYIERRIIEALFGRERADMDAVLGHEDLVAAFAELDDRDEHLRIDLAGRDPDLGLSDVAYEKGAMLLHALERAYGREAFDRFLLAWFDAHAFGSVTTEELEAAVRDSLGREPLVAGASAVDLAAWIHAPALPAGTKPPEAAAFARVDAALADLVAGKLTAAALPSKDWVPQQWLHFLRGLPTGLGKARLAELDTAHALSRSTNYEILAQWLEVAVREGHRDADAALEEFLVQIGRRKFVLPLYQALIAAGRSDDAKRIFGRARAGYHPITQASVDSLLAGAQAGSSATPA